MPQPCNLSEYKDGKLTHLKLNIDYILLRNQKQCLLDFLHASKLNSSHKAAMEGIIGLVDSIQDQAAEDIDIGSDHVFGPEYQKEGKL